MTMDAQEAMAEEATTEDPELRRGGRKRNPEESRRRILDAAESAFSRRGFDGARLRDIAQEAGVHHALVHHYYGDKRGLFDAVVTRGLGRLHELEVEPRVGPGGLEEGVERAAGRLFDFLADNRELLRILEGAFRDRDSVSFAVAKDALGAQTEPLLQSIVGTIREGQRMDHVRGDIPAETLVLHGYSVLVYPFIMGAGFAKALGLPRYGEERRDVERAQLVALIVQALRA